MAELKRFGDKLVASGFPAAAFSVERFDAILLFLEKQEIVCVDDFEGHVCASGYVVSFAPLFICPASGLPTFGEMLGRHALDIEELQALQVFADATTRSAKRARTRPASINTGHREQGQDQVVLVEEMLSRSDCSVSVSGTSKLGPCAAGKALLTRLNGNNLDRCVCFCGICASL